MFNFLFYLRFFLYLLKMSFPFSAQGTNKVTNFEIEKENNYYNFFYSNKKLNVNEAAAIALEKELEKYSFITKDTIKQLKKDVLKMKNLKYLNSKYLSASLVLLLYNNYKIDSNLFDLTNKDLELFKKNEYKGNNDEFVAIYANLLDILGKDKFENLTKVKEQILIYCVSFNNINQEDEQENYYEDKEYNISEEFEEYNRYEEDEDEY